LVEADQKEAAPSEYGILNPGDNPHQGEDARAYVHFLEKRARKNRKEKPYHRGRFPVDFAAGAILLVGGLLLLWSALTSERGLMNTFINTLLPALVLFMLAGLCFVFWKKSGP